MILLDTNVVSELMRADPSKAVMAWFSRRDAAQLFLSTISEAELRTGAAFLPEGRCREQLIAAIDAMMIETFRDHLWSFDSAAAKAYAGIAARRRSAGRPITSADCQIAAIASSHGAAVATRNTADFADTGVNLVNPWSDEP